MTKTCDTCGHCMVHGYSPYKEIMTISYTCDIKQRHVTPGKEPCPSWTAGDPWERAKREWETDHVG